MHRKTSQKGQIQGGFFFFFFFFFFNPHTADVVIGTAAEQPGRTTDGSGNQRTTNPSSQAGEALIASQLFYRGTE
ncbi:hypothetical protein PoMZ_07279 [Pyricularia oryzae]|uniref:Uncharacterized protein n=1 Tax=Pyricularia oryzae TaxID=318829 RepID=A0A4P7NEP1_PYROR|nr:hypothetical protein PoMZ_07279 [Pyricularia oryzae]